VTVTPATPPPVSTLPVGLDDPWLRRLRSGIVAAMTSVVVTVALLAFVASFGAIHAFALRSGGIAPGYAWMAPLFVDSFIFVGACGDLWHTLTQTGCDQRPGWEHAGCWAPKGLLITAAAASYTLNIAHAPPTLAARTIAALAPTALVITEITLMLVVRAAAGHRTLRLTSTQPQPGQPTPSQPARPDTARDLRAEACRLLTEAQASGQPLSGAGLARQLGTSARHGRRLLAAYRTTTTVTDGRDPAGTGNPR
jgi:Protein of unknown function (DUF2637)